MKMTCRSVWMNAGMRNASVFPVPVWAMPMRSFPESRYGHACAWIGEGRSKPCKIKE